MDEAQDRRGGWEAAERGSPQRRAAARAGLPERGGRGGSEPLDQRLERWVSRGRDLVDGVSGARPGGRGPAAPGRSAGGRPGAAAGGAAGGFNPAGLGRWVEERLDWLLDDDSDDHWREPWQEAAPRQGMGDRSQAWGNAEGQRRAQAWRSAERDRPQASPEAAGSEQAAPLSPPAQARVGAEGRAPAAPSRRRGLEAVSRRQGQPEAPARAPATGEEDAWPDEETFSVNHWRRPEPRRGPDPLQPQSSRGASQPAAGPAEAPLSRSQTEGGRPLPRSTRRR